MTVFALVYLLLSLPFLVAGDGGRLWSSLPKEQFTTPKGGGEERRKQAETKRQRSLPEATTTTKDFIPPLTKQQNEKSVGTTTTTTSKGASSSSSLQPPKKGSTTVQSPLETPPKHSSSKGGAPPPPRQPAPTKGSSSHDDNDRRSPLIINGDNAELGAYPFFVAPPQGSGGFCGASLIAPDIVVTAAHCDNAWKSPGQAIVGTYLRYETNTTIVPTAVHVNITAYLAHPDYDGRLTNDVMVMKIEPPALQNRIIEINLNPQLPVDGEVMTAIGLGRTGDEGTAENRPTILQEVTLKKVNDQDCQRRWRGNIQTYLCAWDNETAADNNDGLVVVHMICSGDSGSPLIGANGTLVGIASFGHPETCLDGPGGFTRVSSYANWLQDSVCAFSDHVPAYIDCNNNATTTDARRRTRHPTPSPSSLPTPGIPPGLVNTCDGDDAVSMSTCDKAGGGSDYRGCVARTRSGTPCQRWDSQVPHEHEFTPQAYPGFGLEDGPYCRNPEGNVSAGPWCFTTDPRIPWGYCAIPECETCQAEQTCALGPISQSYRGCVNTTLSGRTCQRWDTYSPHPHEYSPGRYPMAGLEGNYCRQPAADARDGELPWCYTTDPFVRWEYCSVQACPVTERPTRMPVPTSSPYPTTEMPSATPSNSQLCKDVASSCERRYGGDYRGCVSQTVDGIECQAWSSQFPHIHSYTPENFPNGGLNFNYCRNPAGDGLGPWCYTSDPNVEWGYCAVPECETCVAINATCNDHRARDYRGCVAETSAGIPCQRWDAQYPHVHEYTKRQFPNAGLVGNYCRSPDDGDPSTTGPWCYTTDPEVEWGYCKVPECEDCDSIAPTCNAPAGRDYRGCVAQTARGIPCQRWDSQEPHSHDYYPEIFPSLEGNYCRTPDDGDPNVAGPWCFTMDPQQQWGYCQIPECERCEPDATAKCSPPNGPDYNGCVSVTVSGIPCQRWDAQFPHVHGFTPARYPDQNLTGNYCRNPDSEVSEGPWCYTTDDNVRWEYCDIAACGNWPTLAPSTLPPTRTSMPSVQPSRVPGFQRQCHLKRGRCAKSRDCCNRLECVMQRCEKCKTRKKKCKRGRECCSRMCQATMMQCK